VLTGLVVEDDKLVRPLFNLQLPAGLSLPLKPSAEGVLHLKGVGVTLTSAAAAAVTGVCQTNALAAGFEIGTANVYVVFQDHRSDYDQN